MDAKLPEGQLSLAQLIQLSRIIEEQTDRKTVRGAILAWQSRTLRTAGTEAVLHFRFPRECLPPAEADD
ncbi:MAG: hypothetical protein U0836_01940 [Pirellulales bacterium]